VRSKEIIGKKIIDASGNEVGEVEDIEIDWDTKSVSAIILGGKGEMAEKLFGRLGARSAPDISVPVDAIAVMGSVVVLSKKISDLAG
jgi:sporulation protein YlmC with PRC-barrel domain